MGSLWGFIILEVVVWVWTGKCLSLSYALRLDLPRLTNRVYTYFSCIVVGGLYINPVVYQLLCMRFLLYTLIACIKQAAHRVMALPNVIWPWSIFYSKDPLLGRKIKNLSKKKKFEIEYSKLINCLGGMCQTCQGTTIYGMFGI
jgi:hypothetical protein